MAYNLLILSDSHLFQSRDHELFGVKSYHSLQKLSAHIRETEKSIDLTVALGDLSEDGHPRAYEDFYELTRDLAPSGIWIKGNHDRFDNLSGELLNMFIHPELKAGLWSFIFLDTTIEGKDEGAMNKNEMSRLKAFLRSNNGRHLLIFMHHHPIDVGSEFIDSIGLQNKGLFWELIAQNPSIKGIVFGHVHQVIDEKFNGIRLLSTPSTCVQFKPGSPILHFGDPFCGFRIIRLHQDGTIETKIAMIPT